MNATTKARPRGMRKQTTKPANTPECKARQATVSWLRHGEPEPSCARRDHVRDDRVARACIAGPVASQVGHNRGQRRADRGYFAGPLDGRDEDSRRCSSGKAGLNRQAAPLPDSRPAWHLLAGFLIAPANILAISRNDPRVLSNESNRGPSRKVNFWRLLRSLFLQSFGR